MDASERHDLVESLERGQKIFLESVRDLTEDDARWSPGPGRWSVLEVAEHLAVAEHYLLGQINRSEPLAHRPDVHIDPRREVLIRARAVDRSRPVPAPEVARPTGRFPTLAAAVDHFSQTRCQTVRFVETCDGDFRTRLAEHPLIGSANCYEMLLMIALHPHRHSRQIEEIRAALTETKLHPEGAFKHHK